MNTKDNICRNLVALHEILFALIIMCIGAITVYCGYASFMRTYSVNRIEAFIVYGSMMITGITLVISSVALISFSLFKGD